MENFESVAKFKIYRLRQNAPRRHEIAAFVVSAQSEDQARRLCAANCGLEGEKTWKTADCEAFGFSRQVECFAHIILRSYHV